MAWRNLIFHDFWLKLFALLLAVLLWFTVSFLIQRQGAPIANPLARVVTTDFAHLPIKVVKQASDLRVYRVTPSEVELTVRGNPDLLSLLSADDIEASVDLSQVRADRPFEQQVKIRLPGGVTPTRLSPEEVLVEPIRPIAP